MLPILLLGSGSVAMAQEMSIDAYTPAEYPKLYLNIPDEDRSGHMMTLRVLLTLHGYDKVYFCYPFGFEDGDKKEVLAFQKSHNLIQDGIVGSQTWQALLKFPELKLGSKGPMVKNIQKFLNAYYDTEAIIHFQGNMPSKMSGPFRLRLVVNGIFDKTMQDRIKIFQRATKLQADGVIDLKTWRVLAFDVPTCSE